MYILLRYNFMAKKKEQTKGLWKESHIFFIYECSRKGMAGTEIAKTLEVSYATFNKWLERYPLARMAVKKGKQAKKDKGATFRQYMMNQMTEDQREVWNMIEAANIDKTGFALLDEIVSDQGERSMQTFYLQALVSSNFNSTRACAMLGISFKKLEEWQNDPTFADMISEIEVHKKNFFEDAFIDLASEGNPGAIIHANKTLNADRGYSEKRTITHEGTIEHQHNHMLIDVTRLKLSVDCRKELLKAIREQKAEQGHIEDRPMRQALPA